MSVAVGRKAGRYVRRLTAPVRPAEMVWQFDDDDGLKRPGRRLRVEVVMAEVTNWGDGPFLPEAPSFRQRTTVLPKGVPEGARVPSIE